MLISICYLVIKGLLQSNSEGSQRLMDYLDEQRMNRLYEQHIRGYSAKEHPALTVAASQIPWNLDDGMSVMLPIMQSDIMLTLGNNVLIIDAKYYSHTTQTQFDSTRFTQQTCTRYLPMLKTKTPRLENSRTRFRECFFMLLPMRIFNLILITR